MGPIASSSQLPAVPASVSGCAPSAPQYLPSSGGVPAVASPVASSSWFPVAAIPNPFSDHALSAPWYLLLSEERGFQPLPALYPLECSNIGSAVMGEIVSQVNQNLANNECNYTESTFKTIMKDLHKIAKGASAKAVHNFIEHHILSDISKSLDKLKFIQNYPELVVQ